MDFNNDVLRLRKAIGKDTDSFIEVFNNISEKYPDKKEMIIEVIECEIFERGKKTEAFIEEATAILKLEKQEIENVFV